MATIKEHAEEYEAPQTLNIADLGQFAIDIELLDGEGKDKDGEVFKYKYAIVNDLKYRVPNVVIGGIKTLLKEMPNLSTVKVVKEGAGLSTRYQVIPLNSKQPENKVEVVK